MSRAKPVAERERQTGPKPGTAPDRVLALVGQAPGLRIPEIAARLEASTIYVRRVVQLLEIEGAIERTRPLHPERGPGWRAAPDHRRRA